jgi:hypothetical protein
MNGSACANANGEIQMAARVEGGAEKYEIDLQPDLIVASLRPDLDSVERTVPLVGFVGPSRNGKNIRLYTSLDFDTYYEISSSDVLSRSRLNSDDENSPSSLRVKASAKLDLVSSKTIEAGSLAGPSLASPSGLSPVVDFSERLAYPSNPLGDAVWAFANARLGQEVGAGECTDLVQAALRAAGAWPGDTSNPPYYVWGNVLPQPPQYGTWQNGDIIQFANAHFQWTQGGATQTWGVGPTGRHTSIIWDARFTNSGPWDTWLIHQNDGVRKVTQRQVYLHNLVSGQFFVYRPRPA